MSIISIIFALYRIDRLVQLWQSSTRTVTCSPPSAVGRFNNELAEPRLIVSCFHRYSTGGSIPNLLEGLSEESIGATGGNPNDTGQSSRRSCSGKPNIFARFTGHIFEKFSLTDPDAAVSISAIYEILR